MRVEKDHLRALFITVILHQRALQWTFLNCILLKNVVWLLVGKKYSSILRGSCVCNLLAVCSLMVGRLGVEMKHFATVDIFCHVLEGIFLVVPVNFLVGVIFFIHSVLYRTSKCWSIVSGKSCVEAWQFFNQLSGDTSRFNDKILWQGVVMLYKQRFYLRKKCQIRKICIKMILSFFSIFCIWLCISVVFLNNSQFFQFSFTKNLAKVSI